MNALLEALLRRQPQIADMAPLIRQVFHTSMPSMQNQPLQNAAWIADKALHGIHVTDNPSHVIKAISSGKGLRSPEFMGTHPELGAGLYMSAVPEFWSGRSANKWNFLNSIDEQQKGRLIDALLSQVDQDKARGWISPFEHEYAVRDAGLVRDGTYPPGILVSRFANQPYNIRFDKPSFLEPLGIAPGEAQINVPVQAKGLFAELNRHLTEDDVGRLIDAGIQGAYTRPSFANNAEAVIWDANAVRKFGDWHR